MQEAPSASPMKRLLVVLNGHASRAETIGPALGALATSGFALDIRPSADREDLARIIRSEGPAADAVVVAGGDGTINGALAALLDIARPVGILPVGTANDLALTLGIPVDPVAAAGVIAADRTRPVDLGRVNDVLFINVASIGLSVEIAQRQDENLKKQWGVLSYFVAAIGTLRELEQFPASLVVDGTAHEVHASQIAIGNGVHYGGGMTIAADARIDDGQLDAYAIEVATPGEIVAITPLLRDGTLADHARISTWRARTIRLETKEPMPVNTDGEVTTETPADFSVIPAALRVFAPASGT